MFGIRRLRLLFGKRFSVQCGQTDYLALQKTLSGGPQSKLVSHLSDGTPVYSGRPMNNGWNAGIEAGRGISGRPARRAVGKTHSRTTQMSKCGLCGETMPGEEMFNYHGLSGPCPKPHLPKKKSLVVYNNGDALKKIEECYLNGNLVRTFQVAPVEGIDLPILGLGTVKE